MGKHSHEGHTEGATPDVAGVVEVLATVCYPEEHVASPEIMQRKELFNLNKIKIK